MRYLLFFLILSQLAVAQNKVTLNECYEMARDNYPNLKQSGAWQSITSLNQENLKTAYLPQVSLNGQVTYQSDVPGIDVSTPGFSVPKVSKDQYTAYAEIRQSIWDGGVTSVQSELQDALLKNHLSQVEVEAYRLYEQVAQAFFTAMVLQKQTEVVEEQKKAIGEKLKMLESAVRHGVSEPTNVYVLKGEILTLDQKKLELEAGTNSALGMLSILTGTEMNESSELDFSPSPWAQPASLSRPETILFSSQSDHLTKQIDLLDKSRNPKLFGFGKAGFGKPGLNMLSNKFDTWYLVGVGVSWTPFDWKTTERKKQIIKQRQQILQFQDATFRKNIEVLLTRQRTQIDKLNNLIATDKELVSLRQEISKAAASKLENESITASDYILEIKAETVAKINYELHLIQLDEAREMYDIINGKLNEGI